MSLYKKMQKAWRFADWDTWMSCYHDDYEFHSHATGEVRRKSSMKVEDLENWAQCAMDDQRLLYENKDIIVDHAYMFFPNGSSEAVLAFHRLKDGKIWRTETGATPVEFPRKGATGS